MLRLAAVAVGAARGKVASEVMSRDVVTVRDTAPVAEALRIMIGRVIKVLPVVDEEGRFVGTLNRSALLAALAGRGGNGHGGTEA
jgi:DHA2 family multidrug resistance protein-like MFS transporter